MRKIILLVFGVMTVVPVMGNCKSMPNELSEVQSFLIGRQPLIDRWVKEENQPPYTNELFSVIGTLIDFLSVEQIDERSYEKAMFANDVPSFAKDIIRARQGMKLYASLAVDDGSPIWKVGKPGVVPGFPGVVSGTYYERRKVPPLLYGAVISTYLPVLALVGNCFHLNSRQQKEQAIAAYLGSLKEGSAGRNRINKYKKMLRISILARLVLKLILGGEKLAEKYTNPMLFGRIFESLWRTAEIAGIVAASRRVLKDALEYEAKFNAQEAGPVAGEVIDEDDSE